MGIQPTNTLDRAVADDLVQLAHHLRPAWHTPGIRAAITASLNREQPFTVAELAHAIAACASDPGCRTPAVIAHDGPHWPPRRPSRSRTGRCDDCGAHHPSSDPCAPGDPFGRTAEAATRDRAIAEARAILAEQKTRHCPHHVPPSRCADCRERTARAEESIA